MRFADVVLDLDRMQLIRAGREIPVEPQVFEVLGHLVRNRDRLVPKTELLDEIWGDRFVSESALSSRIKSARQAIGDNGRDQRLIRTVHGRGFRFVGEVEEVSPSDSPAVGSATDEPLSWSADQVPATVVALLREGRGATIELVGPSGPARTDVLDDILQAASDEGIVVGRGGDLVELRPLAGLLGAVDEWVQRRPDLLALIPASCAAELRSVLEGHEPSSRQRLVLSIRELLVAAGRSGGGVLGIDSVHLVDAASLDLLTHLSRSLRRVPVVLVVTHREGFRIGAETHTVLIDSETATLEDLVPTAIRAPLARIAVVGEAVDEAELLVAGGLPGAESRRVVEIASAAGVLVRDGAHLRFADAGLVEALVAEVPPQEQSEVRRRVAASLVEGGAAPERIADLLLAAGDLDAAAPHLLEAAAREAVVQMHGNVLEHTEDAAAVRDPAVRYRLLELRADAAAALGAPDAVSWYRAAIRDAPEGEVPWLRARMARAYVMGSDLDGAIEAMEGVTPSGQLTDGGILLIAGMVAYLRGDLDRAAELAEEARPYALMPGAPSAMLDVLSLQGMIAHSRGEWFDRLRMELRFSADSRELASTVFDSHLCVAQYLLYGPTGYAEVIRMAQDLRDAAEAQGSRPAAGFALTLRGEALLLSGDLDAARESLRESVELHAQMGADTGHAHSLQRLADVELALGDRAAAEVLCRRALPLARWSPLSSHLLQRLYGTLIAAAPDPASAAAMVDEAMEILDGPTACEFCQVLVAVPAAAALAAVGRVEEARHQLADAQRCAARWEGPAWEAAIDETRAMIARIEGDETTAQDLFARAAAGFEAAGQPLDRARCAEAIQG
jgi:DNA-binding winged helix-turn-helix (wHTH) protein/tetratricopeptide (TPR) repeat protein